MLSRSEIQSFLTEHPDFDDISNGMRSAARFPNKALLKETRKVVALARKFNKEVVIPHALELDRKKQEEHDYLPWEFVQKANEWGFFTMWIPRFFGGRGCSFHSMFYFIEEIASQCLAMANLIGVHYLGAGALFCAWNIRVCNEIFREVAEGEKHEAPCLITAATTEPGAGTDCEETELLDKGTLTCRATRVDGGYRINGSKIFISNGHLSTWHNVVCYEDPERPSETAMLCLVKTGADGFSFGRQENKMGQLACPASELIFRDCFVPDRYVSMNNLQMSGLRGGEKGKTREILSQFFSASRLGVAAFGVGAARGAYQKALRFALNTEVSGKLLINHQWAQNILAEMYKNVASSRLSYIEGADVNGIEGMLRPVYNKPLFYIFKYYPFHWMKPIVNRMLESSLTTRIFRKLQLEWMTEDQLNRNAGWGALAKFMATDAGMKNSHLALELMGQAGVRHDREAEKIFRDAKLLQIYEGTNQLNRQCLFESFIGRHYPQVRVYEHES
ncbi:MAG: acyl-CoA/acyl-ACP dehydrogenase [Desulfobacteraceae bacterium]|nr:acyl-CoA/acyl-ACP dehydrogenase [Desulfobacteraceae bacterium]